MIEFMTESHPGMPCRLPPDTRGEGIDGSANAPKAMPIRSGKCAEYQNAVDPRSGRKCCSTFRHGAGYGCPQLVRTGSKATRFFRSNIAHSIRRRPVTGEAQLQRERDGRSHSRRPSWALAAEPCTLRRRLVMEPADCSSVAPQEKRVSVVTGRAAMGGRAKFVN